MGSTSLEDLRARCADLPAGDDRAAEAALARQGQLTKPPGSLGRLEELAIWLARWQGRERPKLDRVAVLIFAGSHGVARHGVSAFPPEVTAQMVANFEAGGAAINQLAQAAGASLKVHPLSVDRPCGDITIEPALDEAEFVDLVSRGIDAVCDDADLVCIGEMGIANTTPAAAICLGLYGGRGADWVGRGTGVDDAGLVLKADVIERAVARHRPHLDDPLALLRCLGGREFAAMFGAALGARLKGVPLVFDGFIATAAVAPLQALNGDGLAHGLAAHMSAEKAHKSLLTRLGKRALMQLDMRLGEGSGAALAVNILRAAIACHNGMATFAEAGVSE
ncbi:MAG TPA: nicotinate-nucleotide--dimethylbenzimidazole phosphoribosyltransferase [Rhodobacteraceae bacterium]|nr:nicotinate-nucleotide--dimethylbenzimidazole phosphoribosyltransferase [Paracoccaceae bacterium]